jgi:hypothetical protein
MMAAVMVIMELHAGCHHCPSAYADSTCGEQQERPPEHVL